MMKDYLQALVALGTGFIVLVALVFGFLWVEGLDDEADFNNGICTCCSGDYEFSNTAKSYTGITYYYYNCNECGNVIETVSPMKIEK